MKVGIWIDRQKAYLVTLDKDGQHISRIDSEVEGKFRPGGKIASASTSSPRQISSDRKADERRRHQLHRYYQQIIKQLKNADSIFIFGPGQAKEELEKELESSQPLSAKVAVVETADQMTEKQMAARVREFFQDGSMR